LRNHKKRHRHEGNSAKKRQIVEDDEGRLKAVRLDLDSRADTGLFGDEAMFYNDTGIQVAVDTFKKGLGVLDVKIGSSAVAWDHPQTLRMDGMPSHLANPMQMRCHGVIANECQLVMLPEDQRTPEAHSIIVEQDDKLLHIPMTL
jgi:hypothetical protein